MGSRGSTARSTAAGLCFLLVGTLALLDQAGALELEDRIPWGIVLVAVGLAGLGWRLWLLWRRLQRAETGSASPPSSDPA